MSRRFAQKRIQYVRAVFNPTQQGQDPVVLEAEIRRALISLPQMKDTEIAKDMIGTVAVTLRDVASPGYVLIAIGAAAKDELMATMGFNVDTGHDSDRPAAAEAGRGWKTADAFVLIDDNEVLVCTDGGMRLNGVEWYLRSLIGQAGGSTRAQAFGLVARAARQAQKTLDAEGIKEIKLSATAYAASEALDPAVGGDWLQTGWTRFMQGIREAFENEARDDAEREAVINHFAELNVTAVVSVAGGSRGEPTMVRSLGEVAREVLSDAPDGTNITLITKKGNPVTADSFVLSTTKTMRRLTNQNSLDATDCWSKLATYRKELAESGRWKE